MSKKIIFITLTCLFVACGNKLVQQASDVDIITSDSIIESDEDDIDISNDERFWFDDAQENHKVIMQAIIDGDAEKLAYVIEFPIYQGYPLKDINNARELKQFFNILFDDSIKNVLQKASLDDWSPMGWRGCMLLDGEYLWTTEEGLLHFVTYESQALKQYEQKMRMEEQKMRMEEQQDLNESTEWFTHSCYLAEDSSVFLRLETFDGVERLHVFTQSDIPYKRHLIFNGSVEYEGSCHNEVYWYACEDSVISVMITSPMCIGKQDLKVIADHIAIFPKHYNLPDVLQGKTIPLQRAYWRDVKKWWK